MRSAVGRVVTLLAVAVFVAVPPLVVGASANAASANAARVEAAPVEMARATLRESTPGANQTVDRLPELVTLVFDESPAAVKITVTGPDGTDVVSSPPNIRGVGVRQPVRPGAAGRYTVRYEMSPVTGPPAVGSFDFTVSQAGPAPAPTGAAPPTALPAPSVGATTTAAAASTSAGIAPAPGATSPAAGTSAPSARAARDGGGTSTLAVVILVLLGVAAAASVVLVLRSRTGRGTA
ncbi:copper resistance CopC family protein [Micromonospora sp. NPDC050417]|uniref:copper resistance CopC family protein n=1 Tax=Micromonospora sp. NPDC050417 TaxID=3364280 RepID=UPI0037A4A9C0